jgi:hypothetical protein
LVVDPNRVLAAPVAAEGLQAVARWHAKVIERLRGIQQQ